MHCPLVIHPSSRSRAASHIEVEVTRPSPSGLALRYLLTGDVRDILLPAETEPARTDELWKHTCFEAFVRPRPGTAYCELNFAPSTQWAAYAFDSRRTGMRPATDVTAPRIQTRREDAHFELQVSLVLPGLALGVPWQLGLSAVIEEAGGRKSYWALAHPPGQADFHHSDCFALELPAA